DGDVRQPPHDPPRGDRRAAPGQHGRPAGRPRQALPLRSRPPRVRHLHRDSAADRADRDQRFAPGHRRFGRGARGSAAMIRTSVVAAALLASSCSSGAQYAQAVVALVDVSGTYADQRPEVVGVIRKGLLPKLTPGDTLIVIRIASARDARAHAETSW